MRRCVRNRIRQDDPFGVAQGATGIDNICDIAFSHWGFGPNARPGQNPRRISFVQQNGANGIFADGSDAVGKQQPAFVEIDRRTAIADLHELPVNLRLQDLPI